MREQLPWAMIFIRKGRLNRLAQKFYDPARFASLYEKFNLGAWNNQFTDDFVPYKNPK